MHLAPKLLPRYRPLLSSNRIPFRTCGVIATVHCIRTNRACATNNFCLQVKFGARKANQTLLASIMLISTAESRFRQRGKGTVTICVGGVMSTEQPQNRFGNTTAGPTTPLRRVASRTIQDRSAKSRCKGRKKGKTI